MTPAARRVVFGAAALGFAALLAWGFAGLPAFGDFNGSYGTLLSQIAVPERTASNVVGSTTFDFRGFDTLGEEFILFGAAIGVLTLLRIQRSEDEGSADPDEGQAVGRSHSVRVAAIALAGPALVLGIYVVVHGHLTPGGGFQGGVILMSAFLLIYLAGTHLRMRGMKPIEGMELAEGLGAAGFVLIGVGGLVFTAAYLQNFLPLGRFTYLWSGGTIPLAEIVAGVEVLGATLAILAELLDQRLLAKGDVQ